MNDYQHSAYEAYLRLLAGKLLLGGWEITLKRAEVTTDCFAQVWVMDTENHAVIRVDEAFWHGTDEDRREWLVHELLHCHVDRPDRVIRLLEEQLDDNREVRLARTLLGKELEVAVQNMARIIAPFMPLPPRATEGEAPDGETRNGRTDADTVIDLTPQQQIIGRKEPQWRGPEPEPARPPSYVTTQRQPPSIRVVAAFNDKAQPGHEGQPHQERRRQCGQPTPIWRRQRFTQRQLPGL